MPARRLNRPILALLRILQLIRGAIIARGGGLCKWIQITSANAFLVFMNQAYPNTIIALLTMIDRIVVLQSGTLPQSTTSRIFSMIDVSGLS